jgi:hypothetical protein
MDFIELFDACVREVKPRIDKYTKPASLDSALSEEAIGLDSLDVTLTLVLLSDIYGIPKQKTSISLLPTYGLCGTICTRIKRKILNLLKLR